MAIANFDPDTAPKLRKGPSCTVCAALESLPPSEAEAFERHLRNPRYRYQQLADDLRADPDNPLDMQASTIARHARGNCAAQVKCR